MRALVLVCSAWLACGGAPIEASSSCPATSFDAHPRHARFVELLAQACRTTRAPGCVVAVDRPNEPLWMGSVGLANLSTGAPLCRHAAPNWQRQQTLRRRDGHAARRGGAALARRHARAPAAEGRWAHSGVGPHHRRAPARPSLGRAKPREPDVFTQTDYFDRPAAMVDWTLEERFERFVYDRPLLFEPGASQRYSNPGYDLLGWVVEAAAEAPLEEVLRRQVLAPLGHTATSFFRRDDPAIPPGYTETSDGVLLDVTVPDKANVNAFSPSGGLVSTVGEVHAFMRALFGGRLVSRASLDVLQRGAGANRQGLFVVELSADGLSGVGHQGALIGQSTWALYVPSRDAIIVFSSTMSGSARDVLALSAFLEDP